MASTRVDKYKEKRDSIEKMNESFAPKKKVVRNVPSKEGSKEKILEDLGIDTSFGLEEKSKPTSLEKLTKGQEKIYQTQEMKKITDVDIKKEGSVSKIMDTMKKDLPLNDNVTNIKPAKRTQISPEFVSAKEKYAPKKVEDKKEEKKEVVVNNPKPKLVINDNTKKVKEMPKTSATKIMGIDDILEVKAKQNSDKKPSVNTKKVTTINSDALLLRVCLIILAIAILAIVLVLILN